MTGYELLDKLTWIDPQYIKEAEHLPSRRRNHPFRRLAVTAACLGLALILAVPSLAAASPALQELLYAFSPAAAQFVVPVQRSSEANGIRMTVEAVSIHQSVAEIYLTLCDLEGQRLDESIDLFDSYRILTPFSSTGSCQLLDFDPASQTASLLVTIRHWKDRPITGGKLTFLLREILTGKESSAGIIEGIGREDVDLLPDVKNVRPRGVSGPAIIKGYMESGGHSITVLEPNAPLMHLDDGVALTGIGVIDGNLHVQVYYEDILHTDNHGSIGLTDTQTGESIDSSGSAAFFAPDGRGSYEDYIFIGIGPEILDTHTLFGSYVTSDGAIEGSWRVTFPLEEE